VGNGLVTTAKYLGRTTSGTTGNDLGTTAKYLRRTTSGAGNSLGAMAKYLRVAAGIGLGTTIKYLRRTTRQRTWHHGQLPAMHSERRRGQQPGN
jgi:type IV secretory pathway TrbL component